MSDSENILGDTLSSASEIDTETTSPEDDTDWNQYTAYTCIYCYEDCINKIGSAYARSRECRECFGTPTLDRHAIEDDLVRGGEP